MVHSQTGEIVKRTMISVTTQRLHKRLSDIYYSRVGMQVRVIDDIPFGQYDYSANQATKVKNTTGVAKTSSGTYTGIDGNSYENAYCDIRLSNEGTGASVVAANTDDIQNVIKKMVKGTLMQNGASNSFNAAKGYFEAKGPAYVQCHGVRIKESPSTTCSIIMPLIRAASTATQDGVKTPKSRTGKVTCVTCLWSFLCL